MARAKKVETEIQNEVIPEEVNTDGFEEIGAEDEMTYIEVTNNKVEDLSDVTDITAGNQTFNEDTVYEVLKTFTIIIGNGAVEGEVGKRIKISKAEEGVIRTLLADGYIKIVK